MLAHSKDGSSRSSCHAVAGTVPEDREGESAGVPTKQGTRQRVAASQLRVKRKRGHYVFLACFECKKRKTKCDGAHPCSRCAKSGKRCMFPRNASHRRGAFPLIPNGFSDLERNIEPLPQIAPLMNSGPVQREACSLSNPQISLRAPKPANRPFINPQLRSSADVLAQPETSIDSYAAAQPSETTHPTLHDSSPSLLSACGMDHSLASQSRTRGIHMSTTAHYKYNINLAQKNLKAQGVFNLENNEDVADSFVASENSRRASPGLQEVCSGDPAPDPIWLIPREEASRLCDVYEEEINISHPFLDMRTIRNHVKNLYDSLEVLSRHGCSNIPLQGTAIAGRDDLKIVKMVFSTALITEKSGPSKLAKALFDDVKSSTQERLWEDVNIPTIIIFFLLAMWQFLADNDTLAWRFTGIVARWCLEIGMNQSHFIRQMPGSNHDRKMAVRLFWCIHTLDRRWGFGNGLPFVIQDSDIDESFPEPDDDVPYLRAMVSFSHIVSAVWYTSYVSPTDTCSRKGQDEISYLDFRITKWWDNLPLELQLVEQEHDLFPRGMQRLRILLYLRKCQLKILLHQPVLHSAVRIQQHPQIAEKVVELAKDVIWRLDDLSRSTDIYYTQQMCFNYFLVLALGVVLLAIAQAPEMFMDTVREEFYAALDLVQSLSLDSYVSRRLWRFIRGLRPLGDTINVRRQLDKNAGLDNGSVGACPVPVTQAPHIYEPDTGFHGFTDSMFLPFEISEESADTDQLMASMCSVFESMEKEWRERAVQD